MLLEFCEKKKRRVEKWRGRKGSEIKVNTIRNVFVEMIIVKTVYVRRNLWRCDIYVIYMYKSAVCVKL